jgi:hypothetical protein
MRDNTATWRLRVLARLAPRRVRLHNRTRFPSVHENTIPLRTRLIQFPTTWGNTYLVASGDFLHAFDSRPQGDRAGRAQAGEGEGEG